MISAVLAENMLGLLPDPFSVTDDMQPRLNVIEKNQGRTNVSTITQQRDRFADDIPGCAQNGPRRSRFGSHGLGPDMIHILRIETGVEKRRIAEDFRRKGHQEAALPFPYR